jgi:purine-nucleoside phosphorylase
MLEHAVRRIRNSAAEQSFDLAVVLGSGLGALAEEVIGTSLTYQELGLPGAAIAGHAGRLCAGRLGDCRVLVWAGRYHLYEGYKAQQVVQPIRISQALGCRRLLLTCAAGGIHEDYLPGDVMYVADHLNFLGDNPLQGCSTPNFLDLSRLYDPSCYDSLAAWATERGMRLRRGVLAALPGPSYETPAEIRALRVLGADAVSMSTIPEAIEGASLGMQVVALAFIANRAAGLSPTPLQHAEVLAAGAASASRFTDMASQLIDSWMKIPPVATPDGQGQVQSPVNTRRLP